MATTAIKNLPEYELTNGEILIPNEDTAEETNWPRFGNPKSAYIRPLPSINEEEKISFKVPLRTSKYIQEVANYAGEHKDKTVLMLNMSTNRKLALGFCHRSNVIIADGSLAQHERQINKNTISLPALPMTRANLSPIQASKRSILASFQGQMSHACRAELLKLNNNKDLIIKITNGSNYSGLIDATEGLQDQSYTNLLDNSRFGIVARGDALFSYRLLETISRGAIPIIISDGWVLPFDRTINWDNCSLRFHQEAIEDIPFIVEKMEEKRLIELQEKSIRNYKLFFQDINAIMRTMLNEAFKIKNLSDYKNANHEFPL